MKAVPARRPDGAASLWMRLCSAQFVVGVLILVHGTLLDPGLGMARADRTLLAAVTAGVRSFDSEVSLESEAAFGARFGMGVSDRFTVWIDALTSRPTRSASTETANVTALRALAQANLLTGSVRPYVVVGGGGLIFNFEDAFDTAGGIATVGGGIDWRFARRALLFAEGTADLYRARMIAYSATGEESFSSPRETQCATAVSAGIALEF
ncbi:MAG TPA: hypothetical protein VJW75_11595 [Candidatus Eisenbacteria bacterium]|nr:hypothetical protein [Candidatus Eisenbacteria bacterium]